MDETRKIRWAPRLPPRLLERLYHSDAQGFEDLDLCDDVGSYLFARCRGFVLVGRREVDCPACRGSFEISERAASECPTADCDWSTDLQTYRESMRNHDMYPGRAGAAFRHFHERYPTARTYRAKLLLIDGLIHAFHRDEATRRPVKSVGSKLLEGSKRQVVGFLDALSAVEPVAKEIWREGVRETEARKRSHPGRDS